MTPAAWSKAAGRTERHPELHCARRAVRMPQGSPMTCRRIHTDHPPWPSRLAAFLLALVTAAVFGCTTVSYKAGSTGSDYQAARDRCHKEGHAESPDFERCMEAQGWTVKQLGAPAAPSDAKDSGPAKSPSPGSPPSPTAGTVAPSSTLSHAPPAEHSMVVKNWFKLGGTPDGLAAAKQRCATKLGAADPAGPESEVVTGEMLDCLRHEGWRAF